MMDDAQLLHDYSAAGSEPAFAEFVGRHLGWVYHAALRRVGGRHDLAQEIAQYVFTAAARNAASLARRTSVAGWLHITLRYAANRMRRSETRRQAHEKAAHAMNEIETRPASADWDQVRPAIDEVMDRLPEVDREALLLRYFEGKALRDVGAALAMSEDGARKRVDRALDKLRRLLARRGITSTSSALGAQLIARASGAVAPEMQAAVTAGALTGAGASGPALLGLIHFMSATKMTLGGLGLVAAALCLITGGAALYETRQASAREKLVANLQRDYAAAEARLRAAGERVTALGSIGVKAGALQAAETPAPVDAPALTVTTRETRRADGQAFLDAMGGTVRTQYRERAQAEIQGRFALFFRVAGIDPQRQRILAEALGRRWEETLEVTPASITPGVQALTPAEMRTILGDDGWRQWQDFDGRAQAANRWAMAVAKGAGDAGAPVSLDQIAALQRLVREHSADYRNGNPVNDRRVDWTTVYRQSQALLTPAQWQGAQPFLLMRQATHALEAAADGGAVAVGRDTP